MTVFVEIQPKTISPGSSVPVFASPLHKRGHRGVRSATRLCLAGFVATIWGCAGRATVHAIPLGTQRINTSGPLIPEFKPDECYYWIDDDGRLCVAIRSVKTSFVDPRLSQGFVLSFVFDGTPAGSARDFRMNRRTARCRSHAAIFQTRSASLGGIATVWGYGKKVLHGRFRFPAKIQVHHLLAGWRDDGTVVYTGEFSAVCDRKRGQAILAESEGTGMERPAVPRQFEHDHALRKTSKTNGLKDQDVDQ